jgi:DNA polymerase-3 subunit gamma/tau
MAYQALARKWRPRKFTEIVGQEHVVRALTHALEHERLHHAYLFTGTRGVGKTTIARILAKAINCESRQGFDPCGECLICREVDEGRFVDLIEVDAASRTKVEDTRELLDNVLYAPSQGRYKVYLIDEVHMLSGHSFNALLKTLEEPPPHIKFLLATTDPQKIPVTVLSRCLQFNLKRLTPDQIRNQMEAILAQEAIEYDTSAVKSLARAADGSMRDGLSLLDQAIVHGGGALQEVTVSAMLGTVARRPVFALLDAVAAHDAAGLLDLIEAMAEHAPNYGDVLQQILVILHHAALAQWVPDAVRRDDDPDSIVSLARRLGAEDLQLFYQIGLIGQRDLPLAPDPRSGFEMVMLRMLAFRPAGEGGAARGGHGAPALHVVPSPRPAHASPVSAAPAARPSGIAEQLRSARSAIGSPSATAPVQSPPAPAPVVALALEPETLPAQPALAAEPEAAVPPAASEPAAEASPPALAVPADWPSLIRSMHLVAMAGELAKNCVLEVLDESACVLVLDPKLGHLRSANAMATLEKALQTHFRRPLKLAIKLAAAAQETPAVRSQREQEERQRAAEIEIEQDENVRAMKELFDARVVPGTVKPLD